MKVTFAAMTKLTSIEDGPDTWEWTRDVDPLEELIPVIGDEIGFFDTQQRLHIRGKVTERVIDYDEFDEFTSVYIGIDVGDGPDDVEPMLPEDVASGAEA
jgi:hypothetical protein